MNAYRLYLNYRCYQIVLGVWGSVVGRFRDRFPVVSLGIFSVAPPDRTMYPGVDSAPENEYQGFLLGAAGAYG